MKKQLLLFVMIVALLATMLAGCKSNDGELEASDGLSSSMDQTEPDQTPEDTQKDPSSDQQPNKKPNDPTDSHKPADPDQKEPTGQDSPSDQQPGTPSDNEAAPSTGLEGALQKAGTPFSVKAGDTLWFGPMPMNREEMLTLDGKTVKKGDVTEVDKFGGGYRIYSYKVTADGSATLTAPSEVADRFLISKGKEMTLQVYHNHWDKAGKDNLYDPTLDGTGKTISWNGKEKTSSDYHLSHLFALKAGDTLTFGPCNPAQVVQAYGYDAKGKATTLLNGANLTKSHTLSKGLVVYTYTATQEVAGVKILVPDSYKNQMRITKNHVFSAGELGLSDQAIKDPLKGATGLFAGDSVNHGMSSRDEMASSFKGGTGGWAARVERDTGLVATNVGKSGYHFTDVKSNYGPINDLLQANASKDFDYVVLQGGYNDACKKVPLGTVSSSFDLDDFDTTTFAGGMERTLYNTIKYHGDTAAIGFIVTFKIPKDNGIEKEYYDLAKKICDKWGVAYLDLYNHEKLNADLKFDTKEHTNDYVHPDASGYELITPYVIDFMRTMTPCAPAALEAVLG